MVRVRCPDREWGPQTCPLSFRSLAELEASSINYSWPWSSGLRSLPPSGETCFRSWVLDPLKLSGMFLWQIDEHIKGGAVWGWKSRSGACSHQHVASFRRLVQNYQCGGNRMLWRSQGELPSGLGILGSLLLSAPTRGLLRSRCAIVLIFRPWCGRVTLPRHHLCPEVVCQEPAGGMRGWVGEGG